MTLFLPSFAYGQVVNGDFAGGSTGWTAVIPTGSSLTFTGDELTAVSDDDGTGTNSRTSATQSFTNTDAGFLSWLLVSYTSVDRDLGQFDFPHVVVGTNFFWVNTAGGTQATAAGALDNDDTGITNLTIRTTLAPGTRDIGAGVTSTDSVFGAGTAIWDDIEFQEITQSPGAQTTIENTPLTLSGLNALQTATNTNQTITVTLSVTNGVINLGSAGSVTITGGADGSGTVTFTGLPADINTAMDGLVYTPNLNYVGSDTLVYAASGGGISDTDNIPINVTAGTRTMAVSKVADDDTNVSIGQLITYTYTITNTGNQVISDITLVDSHNGSGTPPVPSNEALLVDTFPGGDSLDSVVNGSWDTLAPGDQIRFTATYTVTQSDIDNLQ